MLIEENQVDNTSDQDSDDEAEQIDARLRNKALTEFRFRVEEAILGNFLLSSKSKSNKGGVADTSTSAPSDARLWGVSLFPSHGDEALDVVLGKFLKAKRYKVQEAFTALRKTLKWRAEFRPDEWDKTNATAQDSMWFRSGVDMEGRPLCYSILGKEYQKSLQSVGEVSYQDYMRWRVLCVEKGIQNLNFRPGGVDSIVQIIDMRNGGGPTTKEMKLITKKMITLLHDYYPGIVHKNLIINVPSWFVTLNTLNLRLITKRSKNKFIFVKPSKVTVTLLKYVSIENMLVQYGGLMRENDTEFTPEDKVLEVNIRAGGATELIQIPVNEAGLTLTWDLTVIGHDVTYREEFVPDDDCSYKILLQEMRLGESMRNSFYIREPGKIVITIHSSYTRKKVFYRYKTSRPCMHMTYD